jgi:hypothetical protein
MRYLFACALLLLAGCVAEVRPPRVAVEVRAPAVYVPPPPPPVVSVYVEPPLSQPLPIAVGWAPPPMLVESPPPLPFAEAVWVGGYWVWEGNWVWAHGHWVSPPRPSYLWVHPYYENRDGVVIFITGHWAAPGVAFVPPPMGLHLSVEVAAAGVIAGPRPMGPNGVFVPAPPGSRLGIIVPAPIGTAPAVVTSAPPVVAVGMRVTANVNVHDTNVVNNNTTVINKTTNITNVTNVTIVAPPAATSSGKAFSTSVPAQAHLAAAMPSVVRAQAPEPASTKPISSYVPGSKPRMLPPAQAVNSPATHSHEAPPPAAKAAIEPRPEHERAEGARSVPSPTKETADRGVAPKDVAPKAAAKEPVAKEPVAKEPAPKAAAAKEGAPKPVAKRDAKPGAKKPPKDAKHEPKDAKHEPKKEATKDS